MYSDCSGAVVQHSKRNKENVVCGVLVCDLRYNRSLLSMSYS